MHLRLSIVFKKFFKEKNKSGRNARFYSFLRCLSPSLNAPFPSYPCRAAATLKEIKRPRLPDIFRTVFFFYLSEQSPPRFSRPNFPRRYAAAPPPFFQSLEGRRPFRRRKPRTFFKKRGERLRCSPRRIFPSIYLSSSPFPRRAASQEIGRKAPPLFRPARLSFRSYYRSDFFFVDGQSAKKPSFHSLCRKFFMRF